MPREEAETYLGEIAGWNLIDDRQIEKNYRFKDFRAALRFVNRVGEIAEAEDHHPDILIHDWNRVRLTLSTHAINGLSGNDFILAAKIDQIA